VCTVDHLTVNFTNQLHFGFGQKKKQRKPKASGRYSHFPAICIEFSSFFHYIPFERGGCSTIRKVIGKGDWKVHAVFALYSIMNANRGGFGWVVWDEVAIEICSACWLADAVRPSSFVFRPVSFIILYLRINASFYAAHQVLRPAGFIHPWSYPLSPFSFLLSPFPFPSHTHNRSINDCKR